MTMTDQQRVDVVRYRIQNAVATLKEVESHRENGFYNTAVNRMYYACYYAACAWLIAPFLTKIIFFHLFTKNVLHII